MSEVLELKQYIGRPIFAVRVMNVNREATQIFKLFGEDIERFEVTLSDHKFRGTVSKKAKMRVLTGRGRSQQWRVVKNEEWIIREWDGTLRVFRDNSFRACFAQVGS